MKASAHHSHTLPEVSYRPKPLGSQESTGRPADGELEKRTDLSA